MSFGSRLTHTVSIIRTSETVDGDGNPVLDDYGQPVTSEDVLSTPRAAIQPKSQREKTLLSQGGAAISTHTIFLFPTDLTTADAILHDASDCPVTADLPTARYQIDGIANAAGLGHHLEVDARLVASPGEAEGS